MKNKKSKIIAFVLVFALLITTVIVTSVANAKTNDIQINSDKEVITAGETATISVKLTTNYPVATMSIPVFYDKTLVDISDATTTLTEYSVANATTDAQSVDVDKVFSNTEIDSNKFGFVLVTYIAGANTDVADSIDGVVLTFKITAKTGVSGIETIKVIEESAKTTTNVDGMLYFGASTSNTKITSVPENIENITLTNAIANVNIGGEQNTIALKEGAPFEAIIDTANCGEYNGAIYGFDTLGYNDEYIVDGTIADFITTAYGDEYLEVVVGDAGVETTGTLINVLDKEGNVVETYVYILFGDIDGDSAIGSADGAIAEFYEMNYEGFTTLYQFMAGDLDGDMAAGSADAATMEFYEMNYYGLPTQAENGAMVAANGEYVYK